MATGGGTPTRTRETAAHTASVKIDLPKIVQFLIENLGTALTAFMADADRKTVQRWAEGQAPRGDQPERRLRSAFQIFQLVQTAESPRTVRAWFIGMNPQLDDLSPAEGIAADRERDVLAAARAFLAGA